MSKFKCLDSIWCYNAENGCEHAVEHEYLSTCKLSCFGENGKGCIQVIEKVKCYFSIDCPTCNGCEHGKLHERKSECTQKSCLRGITNCYCIPIKTKVETVINDDTKTEDTPKRFTIYFKEN
jgi:hypothetical protein